MPQQIRHTALHQKGKQQTKLVLLIWVGAKEAAAGAGPDRPCGRENPPAGLVHLPATRWREEPGPQELQDLASGKAPGKSPWEPFSMVRLAKPLFFSLGLSALRLADG